MKKGTAEDVLRVIEGLKDEANIQRTITVYENGWTVEIQHKCYDQYAREDFWHVIGEDCFETFIEAMEFAVGFEEQREKIGDGIS